MHWMQLFKQKTRDALQLRDANAMIRLEMIIKSTIGIFFFMLLRKKILNINLIRHADNEKLLVISSEHI